MPSNTFIFAVFSAPLEGREDEYNDWYDNTHVPDMLKVPGVLSVQRFRFDDIQERKGSPYLAIYEWEGEDVKEVRSALDVARAAGVIPVSPSLDPESVTAQFYKALGKKHTSA